MSAPQLGGTTLADPSAQPLIREYRGGGRVMANGTVNFDLVASGVKRRWELTWTNISSAARDTINTALDSLGASTATFIDAEGNTYTVSRDESLTPVSWVPVPVVGGFVWSASVTLREV